MVEQRKTTLAGEMFGWMRVFAQSCSAVLLAVVLLMLLCYLPSMFSSIQRLTDTENKLIKYQISEIEQDKLERASIEKKAREKTTKSMTVMAVNFEGKEQAMMKSLTGKWNIVSADGKTREIEFNRGQFTCSSDKGFYQLNATKAELDLMLDGGSKNTYQIILMSADYNDLVMYSTTRRVKELWTKQLPPKDKMPK